MIFRIKDTTFFRASEKIETIFPNEKPETYYVSCSPGGQSKKEHIPKGELWSFKEIEHQKQSNSWEKDPNILAHLNFLNEDRELNTKTTELGNKRSN